MTTHSLQKQQDQILKWLGGMQCPPGQEPLRMTHEIESFEHDFSSGYLLGTILTHYGICDSTAALFIKKNNKETKVHNFYQIEEALRRINVKFDAKLIHKVMNEEPGASLKLLNLMRQGLDTYFNETNVSTTNLKQYTVDQKVKKVQDLALKLPQIHKEYGIEGPTFQSAKTRVVEEKLLKFELAKVNLDKAANIKFAEEVNMFKSIQQQKRQDAINKMHENKVFMKEWNETGYQNWEKNQTNRANEIARQKYFEDREIKIYKDSLNKELNFNNIDMTTGIAEFHENLRKLGVEENITIQEAIERQEQKKGIPPGQIQNFSYAATMNKIKETKANNEFAGKERDRRNRKMKVDQTKIQEMLDANKKEELILQKILQKQTEEQQEAYHRQRADKCKEIVFRNRIEKAIQIETKAKLETQKIEKKMRDEAQNIEIERKRQYEEAQAEIDVIRREEKNKRRRINIEIASELVDLIMDVAECAFEKLQENENLPDLDDRLLNKKTWRNWMSIFAEGKKVSEANVVINEDVDLGQTVELEKNPLAKKLGFGVENVLPAQIVENMKNEPVYSEFLQYMTVSGVMNFQKYSTTNWQNIINLAKTDPLIKDRNLHKEAPFQFLQGDKVPQNTELAKLLEKIYSNHHQKTSLHSTINVSSLNTKMSDFGRTKSLNKDQEPVEGDKAVDPSAGHTTRISMLNTTRQPQCIVPNWHTLKLCLIGKAFAGKKTIAQQLKDEIGDQFVIFNMQEIVREALNYVQSPDKKDDAIDPKAAAAKKGAPAKGPAVQEQQVDIFANLDTTAYKEIASHMLQELKVLTGQDKIPGKDTDLIELIKDDNLLVNLFIQKLKLTFHQPPPAAEEVEQKMRNNLAKEKELREQYNEAVLNEESQSAIQVQQTGKGAKGAAAQKNVAKSSKDILNEITQLMSVDKNGWVLVDFPRTVNQAKLIESHINNYRSPSDIPKTNDQENFEISCGFSDPEFNATINYDSQPSFFDSIILLSTSSKECRRRANNRKIDPATQQVYHMEDQPPSSTDPKFIEKLMPTFGLFQNENDMNAFLEKNHIQFQDNEPFLDIFYQEFGKLDGPTDSSLVSLHHILIDQKEDKTKVYSQVSHKIKEILSFCQINKDREYHSLRKQIIIEQEEQQHKQSQEALAAKQAMEMSATSLQKEINIKDQQSNPGTVKEDSRHLQVDQLNVIEDQEVNKRLIASRLSDGATSENKSIKSKSQVSNVGAARKMKKKEFNKVYKQKMWEEMLTQYFRGGMMTLDQIKRQRESVFNSLNVCQTQYISFLDRVDDQQQKLINDFVQSFNKFSFEFPDLRQDDQTKDELMTRVEQLSNNLWKNIVSKKDDNLKEIQKQSDEGWAVQEMRQSCKLIAQMIEIEIKKFNTVFQLTFEQDPPVELDAEIQTKKLIERGALAFDINLNKSPILNQVVAKILQQLDEFFIQAQKDFNIYNHPLAVVMQDERNIFTYRLALLQAWGLTILEEINTYSHQVYSLMDDWIIEAVSQENKIIQSLLNEISDFVKSNQTQMNEYDYQIQSSDLYSKIAPKRYDQRTPPLYIQKFKNPSFKTEDTRFTVDQLSNIYFQIKRALGDRGSFNLLDSQTFISLMILAFRQRNIPNIWKFLDFYKIKQCCEKFSQTPLPSLTIGDNSPTKFQSELKQNSMKSNYSRDWINWKSVMTHFILLNSDLPTEQQIDKFQETLKALADEQGLVAHQAFVNAPAWFDAEEGKPDSTLLQQWLISFQQMNQSTEFEDQVTPSSEVYKKIDEDRLRNIKNLLFNVFRDNNGTNRLKLDELIGTLHSFKSVEKDKTFGEALFEQ